MAQSTPSNVPVTVSTLTRHRVPFPDPYDYVLPGGFTVQYSNYSRPNAIALQELNLCYERAVATAYIKVNHGQGGIPMGTDPQFWPVASTYMTLEPGGQMTWSDWFEVAFYVVVFVDHNDFRGTQFSIFKDGLGLIGTGSVFSKGRPDVSVANNTSVSVLPDPYDLRIQGSTIRFYGYRNPNTVPLVDLNGCYLQAKEVASSKILAGQAEMPVGTNAQSWSSGSVYLRIEPGSQMTWRDWSEALLSIRLFVYTNELKGTQFLFLKDGLGQIGTGSILREPEAKYVATNTSVSVLPNPIPDPYSLRLDGLTVEFSGYRGRVSPFGLEECIVAAYQDVQRHASSGETTMTAPSYSYSAGGVNLYLRPEGQLTWDVWFDVPLRIQGFVMKNKFKETQFVLTSDEFGRIGSGRLVSVAGASIDTA